MRWHLSLYLGRYLMVALGRGGALESGRESPLEGSQPLCARHWTLLWQTSFSRHAEPHPRINSLHPEIVLSLCEAPSLGDFWNTMQLGLVTMSGIVGLIYRNTVAPASSGVANPKSAGLAALGVLGWYRQTAHLPTYPPYTKLLKPCAELEAFWCQIQSR